MLLIDTNILYYAFGLSKHHSITSKKLVRFIDSNQDVKMSSISFAEFVTKYHKHAGIVRRVCSFMRKHHIELTPNQYLPLCQTIIKDFSTIKQKDLDVFYNNLIENKAFVESRFAVCVFCPVLISETVFECNIDPYNVPGVIMEFFRKLFVKTVTPLITDAFKTLYLYAYKTSDAENVIRYGFHNYLSLFISLCMPLCTHVFSEYQQISEGEVVDIEKIINTYPSSFWRDEMTRYQNAIIKNQTPSKFIQKKALNMENKLTINIL